jgi:hypothetical protein
LKVQRIFTNYNEVKQIKNDMSLNGEPNKDIFDDLDEDNSEE